MYTSIMKFIEAYLKANVNAAPVQVGYYGSFPTIDLRESAILLEPRTENMEPHSNVWNKGEFQVRIWILVAMDIDYLKSMEDIEKLLGAEDSDQEIYGLKAALKKMRRDPGFEALNGKMGGSRWRIGPNGLRMKGPTFSINQRTNGTRINTAQLELFVSVESEQ
jgi:hypothetical protein